MIKTPAEIERLRQAAELNERAINAMMRAARPGVTERELAGIYKGEIARAGGQVFWMHMNISRGGNSPVIKDNVLKKGDIFRVDMGCALNGYNAEVCKSGCVGAAPTDEHRRRYHAIQAGVLASVEKLRPGVLSQDLFETMVAGVRASKARLRTAQSGLMSKRPELSAVERSNILNDASEALQRL